MRRRVGPRSLFQLSCWLAAVGQTTKRPDCSKTVDGHRSSRKPPTPIEKDDWWSSFQDPELNSLIERSPQLDLKLLLTRARAAQHERPRWVNFLPSRSGLGTRNRERIIVPAGPQNLPSSPSRIQQFSGAFCFGNWILRKEFVERAGCHADMGCGRECRDVLIILLGDVGRSVCAIRGFQRRSRLQQNIKTQQKTLI